MECCAYAPTKATGITKTIPTMLNQTGAGTNIAAAMPIITWITPKIAVLTNFDDWDLRAVTYPPVATR